MERINDRLRKQNENLDRMKVPEGKNRGGRTVNYTPIDTSSYERPAPSSTHTYHHSGRSGKGHGGMIALYSLGAITLTAGLYFGSDLLKTKTVGDVANNAVDKMAEVANNRTGSSGGTGVIPQIINIDDLVSEAERHNINGQYADALTDCNTVLSINRWNNAALYIKAGALSHTGDYVNAVNTYELIANSNSEMSADAYFQEGLILRDHLKKSVEAKRKFSAALHKDKNNQVYQFELNSTR